MSGISEFRSVAGELMSVVREYYRSYKTNRDNRLTEWRTALRAKGLPDWSGVGVHFATSAPALYWAIFVIIPTALLTLLGLDLFGWFWGIVVAILGYQLVVSAQHVLMQN